MTPKIYKGQRIHDRAVIHIQDARNGHFHECLLPISREYSPVADWGLLDRQRRWRLYRRGAHA